MTYPRFALVVSRFGRRPINSVGTAMKLVIWIVAVSLVVSSVFPTRADDASKLPFNGSVLKRTDSSIPGILYRSQDDPDFVQTIHFQIFQENDYATAVRSLVARAKADSRGAKLKMLERPKAREVIVVYLADKTANRVIYKAERLSGAASDAGFISVSYSAEFEPGNITDEQEEKIKVSAVNALAAFDLDAAQKSLRTSP